MNINKQFSILGRDIHIRFVNGDRHIRIAPTDALDADFLEDEHAQLQNQIEHLMALPDWDPSTIAEGLIEAGYSR